MAAILRGTAVTLRPLQPDDGAVLRRIVATPEVARWWGGESDDFPEHDDPAAERWAILDGDDVVGMIQSYEEDDPHFRCASIDLFLAPTHHGRGWGPDAVGTLVEHLVRDRGHHRITIDPAADNAAAIKAYMKVGFTPVGPLRRAWRDPHGEWRDLLLMERVEPA